MTRVGAVHPIEHLRYVARAAGADASMLVQEAASAISVFGDDPAAMVTSCRRLLTRQPSVGPLWWMATKLVTSPEPYRAARQVIEQLEDDPTSKELSHAFPDEATVLIAGWPDQTVRGLARRGDLRVLALDIEGQGHAAVRRLDRAEIDAEAIDPGHAAGAVEEADLVVIEAAALGPLAALTDVGSYLAAAVARASGTPVWLVAGVGRRVPEPYWQEIVQRTDDRSLPAFVAPFEVVPTGLVDRIVSSAGVQLVAEHAASGGGADLAVASELLRELT